MARVFYSGMCMSSASLMLQRDCNIAPLGVFLVICMFLAGPVAALSSLYHVTRRRGGLVRWEKIGRGAAPVSAIARLRARLGDKGEWRDCARQLGGLGVLDPAGVMPHMHNRQRRVAPRVAPLLSEWRGPWWCLLPLELLRSWLEAVLIYSPKVSPAATVATMLSFQLLAVLAALKHPLNAPLQQLSALLFGLHRVLTLLLFLLVMGNHISPDRADIALLAGLSFAFIPAVLQVVDSVGRIIVAIQHTSGLGLDQIKAMLGVVTDARNVRAVNVAAPDATGADVRMAAVVHARGGGLPPAATGARELEMSRFVYYQAADEKEAAEAELFLC